MKVKNILALLLFGLMLIMSGVFFKILHFAGAEELLISGLVFSIIAFALAIWKLISSKSNNKFLNS
jgi:uncharacterized membrane protein YqjE